MGLMFMRLIKKIESSIYREWLKTFKTVSIFGYPEELIQVSIDIQRKPDEWIMWCPTNRLGGFGKYLPRTVEAISIFGNIPNPRQVKRPRALHTFGRALANKRGLSET